MTLTATFALTPRNSRYYVSGTNWANMHIYAGHFLPHMNPGYLFSFEGQHREDQLYFNMHFSADPTLDYTMITNRRTSPYIDLSYRLTALGERKELALVFGFQAYSEARLLIYSDAGLLGEERLFPGDNQCLIEVETLDFNNVYFIDARHDSSRYGGTWFFKGITGYVV